ncbi:MAG TPA: TlpA disulfide reductase family protein [Kiritimatiellia bacterium]|nr:TlpA disulfide reductase family protein [Kiritimatiellia bacterium]
MNRKSAIHAAWLVVCGLLLLGAGPARGQETDWSADLNRILSRLQSMGHGYYSAAEWQDVFQQIDEVTDRATRAGAWETLVELNAIKAMVLSDMRGAHDQALKVVRAARKRLARHKPKNMARLYVREAAVLSKLGDEAAIGRLIDEFRASEFFDPEQYAYSVQDGRDTPMAIVRPNPKGSDSISITAMEKYRQQARFAAGRPFPEFEGLTPDGRRVSLSDLRGKVVLVDLWFRGSLPWQREVPNLVRLYQEYQPRGFEILGVNLERNPGGLAEFLAGKGITWTQIVGPTDLPRQLGVFGDTARFLLDPNGRIIGRDLKGSDLSASIRQALGVP